MKNKILAIGLIATMIVSMAACGNATQNNENPVKESVSTVSESANSAVAEQNSIPSGVYKVVAAEVAGVQVSASEFMNDDQPFSLEIKENGKVKIDANGKSGKGKYSTEGDKITIKILGEEVKGTYADNTITFENMLNMGASIVFALEGTSAANESNYISDDIKAVTGTWKSNKVANVIGEEVDIGEDSLMLNFNEDGKVSGSFEDTEFGPFNWDTTLGIIIDSEDPSFLISQNDDGSMGVDYNDGENYYCFTMVKQ